MKGVFITFEGPEGSGKTTQLQNLARRLSEAGYEVVTTREPGGTEIGEAIRDILQHDSAGEGLVPEAESLLFAASRAQLVREVILPALLRGACVLCDRFADSTVAYQGHGRGFDVDRIQAINAFAAGDAVPDLTLLLDVEVRDGFARMRERNVAQHRCEDRFEREEAAFHEKVRAGYLALADASPERFRIIDSSRKESLVAGDIWACVETVLKSRSDTAGSAAGDGV